MNLGTRDTPKNLKMIFGVPAKFLKKSGGSAWCRKGSRRRQNPFAAPGKTTTFIKFWGGTAKKNFKILRVL